MTDQDYIFNDFLVEIAATPPLEERRAHPTPLKEQRVYRIPFIEDDHAIRATMKFCDSVLRAFGLLEEESEFSLGSRNVYPAASTMARSCS